MNVRLPFLLSFLFVAISVAAQSEFKVPALTGPVVDETGQLNSSTKNSLESALRSEVSRGGPQVQVLIINSLQGLPIEDVSIKVVEKWKLGSAKKDDGVLLLIAPNERRLRIEVGQGVEGTLPDAIANRIIREIITPRLRGGDLNGAVVDGVSAILNYARDKTLDLPPEPPPREKRMKRGGGGGFEKWIWIILILFFLIGGGRRRRRSGLGGFLLGAALGGMGRGRGGGFGGGGGGWSGGGGGFSGGGASGSW